MRVYVVRFQGEVVRGFTYLISEKHTVTQLLQSICRKCALCIKFDLIEA